MGTDERQMKIGDIVFLTEDEKKVIRPLKENILTATSAFEEASRLCRKSREALWDAIYAMKPELTNFHLVLEENFLVVVGQKKKEECT